MQTNPKHSGNTMIGECMTVVKTGLVAEDAVVFNQVLPYSIKTHERATLLRAKREYAQKWYEEIQNNLKTNTLDKYRIFYTQIQTCQEKLNELQNRMILRMETKM